MEDPTGLHYSLSDLRASEDGGVIVSWIRHGAEVYPRHLLAQKFSAGGTPLWGASHVVVYEAETLQGGYFPTFVSDGSGGAVFAWYYVTCDSTDCAVQRILADGSEWFAHNGVGVSTSLRARTMPRVAFNAATEEIFVFWEERWPGPGEPQYAVYAQKLASSGGGVWGDEGKVVTPFSSEHKFVEAALLCEGDPVVVFDDVNAAVDGLCASRLNTNGDCVWSPGVSAVSTTHSWHLDADVNACDNALVGWTNGGAVYAQNIDPGGTLGPMPGDLDNDGDVDLGDLAALLAAYGTCTGDPAYNPAADLDGDYCVGITDLAELLERYGETCP